MKILYISNLYPPNVIGGYESLCFDVASTLTERGHETVVLTSSYGSRSEQYSGQRVFRELSLLAADGNIYSRVKYSRAAISAIESHNVKVLEKLCASVVPDVLFIWNLHFLSRSFLDALFELGIPIVFYITDSWLAGFLKPNYVEGYFRTKVYGQSKTIRKIWTYLRRERGIIHLGGHAIFSSQYMSDFFTAADIAFDAEAIIHNGVRFPNLVGNADVDRSQNLKPDSLSLLFTGRVVELKGVLTAISALPLIARRFSDLHVTLTILGDRQDSAFLSRLEAQCERLGVRNQIVFHDPVKQSELSKVFDNHDIFIFPSLYEPFSLTLLYAMNAGIPIVSSAAGGNPEAIVNGVSGLLFEPDNPLALADAVEKMARNPALRVNYGAQAKAMSSAFSLERMVGQIDDYLKVLS